MTDHSFPVIHSQLAPASLAACVSETHGLAEPLQIALLRSWSNDVYALTARGTPFILKVYRAAWRGPADVRWELELQDWLSEHHAPVTSVVPLVDGSLFGTLIAPEGIRCFSLFQHAPGDKPTPPWSAVLYQEYGRAFALLHETSTGFVGSAPRFQRTLENLLDESVLTIEARLASHPDDVGMVHQVRGAVRSHLLPFLRAFDWGICHGDVSLDNLHVMPNGQITLYDFDLSCYGWRAWDVCNAVGHASPEHQDAFLSGYRGIRPLSADELAAVPYFVAADVIRMMADELGRWADWFGGARVEAWVNDRMTWLRGWQHDHGT